MRTNRGRRGWPRSLPVMMVATAAALSGCKSMSEKYIALEVWKYEKLFGHLPPGFVPPGAAMQAAPAMRPCGQQAACPPAPCGEAGGPALAGGDCNQCQGGVMEGGGHPGVVVPGVPAGPGGSPGPSAAVPTAAAVTSSRPVVISDEVVLP
ncbi:MAG: hypothetical protein ACKOTB_14315 [Planctomycetia bacterium]